jgi:hypothetical protein
MQPQTTPAEQITGRTHTIRQLLSGRKFGLDEFQRNYEWADKHVEDLIGDLTAQFGRQWEPTHERRAVARYEPYFLGPIITYQDEDESKLIDGQQRITTLLLLLIWLQRLQEGRDDAVPNVETLIYADHFGTKSFTLDDPERSACMHVLLDGEDFDASKASPSVRNLWHGYGAIEQLFPEDLRDEKLPFFIYWLLDRVTIVEISTGGDSQQALKIFETMNDRGLRLTNMDMLKSFILGHVDRDQLASVSRVWRTRLAELADIDPTAQSDFMKCWLRAKYSRTSADDQAIGSAFDKWVKKHDQRIGLIGPSDYTGFVLHDMDCLAGRYEELLAAGRRYNPKLAPVLYNAYNKVTLQYPLVLAAVRSDDNDETFHHKARLVAGYLDIYVARRMANGHEFGYNALESHVFSLMREIRALDADTLAERLGEKVATLDDDFTGIESLGLKPRNRSHIRYLLARISAWLDDQCGTGYTFVEYAASVESRKPFEIEHIWANHPELRPEHTQRKFTELRNRFGALVLLPSDFNASFGDLPYKRKLPKYLGQNLLARSLHPDCYANNPSFLRVGKTHELPFQAFGEDFDEKAIDSRQNLYRRLCELVWSPRAYGLVVPDTLTKPKQKRPRTRAYFDVQLPHLLSKGLITPDDTLVGEHMGKRHVAQLTAHGRIRIDTGEEFDAPSRAAMAVLDRRSWNGWTFWGVERDGEVVKLADIRKRAIAEGMFTGPK